MLKKILVGLAVLAAAIGIATPAESRPAERPGGEVPGTAGPPIPGQYLVVLDDGHPSAVAGEHARQHGVSIRHVYGTALRGYAATMSSTAAQRIARDPRVAWVEQDTLEQPVSSPVPTGVDRIEADKRGVGSGLTVDLPIAIIDTGINRHSNLNVAGGRSFIGGNPNNWGDGNGHGTHVAGTVAARGPQIFGAAPGAQLHSVRVCQSTCPTSAIVAGIDWIAEQKRSGSIDFAAANFSISSADTDQPCTAGPNGPVGVNATHTAICGLVSTGVVFVMAAGNDGRVKLPYPEAFSVSAVADLDGKGGGQGAQGCWTHPDDTLASFSNHGSRVDIAAPGLCITSTDRSGGLSIKSGTSMAAPHVTGAVALYLTLREDNKPRTDRSGVEAVRTALVNAALPQGTTTTPCSYDDTRTGGPLLFLNASTLGGSGECDIAGASTPNSPPTASFTYSCADLTCSFTDTSADSDGNIASRSWTFGDGGTSTAQHPEHAYPAAGTYTVTLTVADNDGATGTTTKSVTVTAPSTGGFTLTAVGYKVRGVQHADLTWSGATSNNVDVYRDGSKIVTVSNSGSRTDNIGARGGGSYTYQVCEAGTSTCSNEVTVSF
jgi:subtilisin